MRKELETSDIEYVVIYCRAGAYSNDDCWHYETCADLYAIERLLDWCKEKDLIIKSVKARIKR